MKPQDDILPVRTVYGDTGKTQNIGLNYLSSEKPIWYAGPDLIASKILTGKTPRILKALEMVLGGRQNRLKSTNLGGMVKIRPAEQDFYCEVIQQRAVHKRTDKPLADFLKGISKFRQLRFVCGSEYGNEKEGTANCLFFRRKERKNLF